jgi:photosystem II stability/assembly factor-like uncharacterized protein
MPRPPHLPILAAAVVATAVHACADSSAPAADAAQAKTQAAVSAPTLTPQQSGTTNRLQAISPVDEQVAWASGVGGTYAVTTDGGATWRAGVVPGAETLEFRDVEGQSATVAYLLAAGVGTDSRIYKTEDGGAHWTLQFQAEDPNAFYDCFAFWHDQRAIVMGDAVNGRLPVLRTNDGRRWEDIGSRLPAAQAGEAAFAASGTCVATFGGNRGWIATGAAEKARILFTNDGGNNWESYETPVIQGTASSGLLSVDFRDRQHGIIGAGELAAPDQPSNNVARSSDGGQTWELATGTPFTGAVYGLSYVDGLGAAVVATGPAGAAWSADEGGQWVLLDGVENYWAVAFASPRAGWLVGTEGRILKLSF